MSDIISCFGLRADTSNFDGDLCHSCKTPLLKYWITGKKISSCKLGASTKRPTLEMCNLSAVILLVITFQRCPILTTSVQTKCNALVLRLIK